MKLKTFSKHIMIQVVLFTTLGIVYAAWDDVVGSGDTLSSANWNTLVGKVKELDDTISVNGSNIGIGTTNPTMPIEVFHASNNSVALFNSGDSRANIRFSDNATTNVPVIGAEGNRITLGHVSGGDRLSILDNGNVGIGTDTPETMLNVDTTGRIRVGKSTDAYYTTMYNNRIGFDRTGPSYIDQEGIGGDIVFRTSASSAVDTSAMHIEGSNGNVGIGTTSPAQKLDVNGTARVNVLKGGAASNFHIDTDIPSMGVYLNWYSTGNVFARNTLLASSDLRLKKNIMPMRNALDSISELEGVTFYWKDEARPGEQIGLIAQDVEKVFPQIVHEDEEGFKTVSYAALVSPLIEAVKELKKENEVLRKDIELLQSKMK